MSPLLALVFALASALTYVVILAYLLAYANRRLAIGSWLLRSVNEKGRRNTWIEVPLSLVIGLALNLLWVSVAVSETQPSLTRIIALFYILLALGWTGHAGVVLLRPPYRVDGSQRPRPESDPPDARKV